jgi:hypothetical protein
MLWLCQIRGMPGPCGLTPHWVTLINYKADCAERHFATLLRYRVFKFDSLRGNDLFLNCFNFRTRYSKLRVDYLFIIHVFEKLRSISFLPRWPVGILVPTKAHRYFQLQQCAKTVSPSARGTVGANDICRILDMFSKNIVRLRTFSLYGKVPRLIIYYS